MVPEIRNIESGYRYNRLTIYDFGLTIERLGTFSACGLRASESPFSTRGGCVPGGPHDGPGPEPAVGLNAFRLSNSPDRP